jgi:hypothetical protein
MFESTATVTSPNPPQVCGMEYQISDSTGYLPLDQSLRYVNVLNGASGYDVVISITTTAQIVVVSAPYLIQATARLPSAVCTGTYTIGGNYASNLRCLKTA